MSVPFALNVDERHAAAITAVSDLLTRLRIEHAFVSGVAGSAWLGQPLNEGSVDVLALMSSESKSQVPMMAGNRGFVVDREEVEAADELDLIPLSFAHPTGAVRCHVLLASNALYAHMVAGAVESSMGDRVIRVVKADDLALMVLVGGGAEAADTVERLLRMAGDAFDRQSWNARLTSIGLRGGVTQ